MIEAGKQFRRVNGHLHPAIPAGHAGQGHHAGRRDRSS
jgi:hypothetical protein